MTRFSLAALALAVLLTGCASSKVVTGTGEAALDAYLKRGMTRGQAVPLAKRTALIVAQRDLIERYAGSFLSSQTEIDNFVAKSDRIISTTGGLIKGVKIVRVQLSPDQTVYMVVVEAREKDLRDTLGDKPDPRAAFTAPFVWPSEIGGVSSSSGKLGIDPKMKTVTAVGTGVIPEGLDPRVAKLRAKRAGKMDALRNLAERINGIRLSATTTVEDYVAKQDIVRAKVDAVIKGARVIKETEKADGTFEVEVAVDVPQIEAALGLK